MPPSRVTTFVALFLCVWMTGVGYLLLSMKASREKSFADVSNFTSIYNKHHLRQSGERKSSIEKIENEALQEVLTEAAEHSTSKGERPEWGMHVGIGRKEDIFLGTKITTKKSVRGQSQPNFYPESSLPVDSKLISRSSMVTVTCDTRGNLGPCTVVNQVIPGTDWLKDRWQAASDMGGTAIPGPHWIMMDFHDSYYFEKIILDWETAYALEYRIEGSRSLYDQWTVLYDATLPIAKQIVGQRTTREEGQSPGVKTKMPLHIIHNINLQHQSDIHPFEAYRYLKVYILRPARGWGVSLWQVDVFGRKDDA